MRNKDIIKLLSKQDPDAFVVYGDYNGAHVSISEVKADKGINDLDGWDVLSSWRDFREMEEFYGASDSDPLAFMSVVILS